MSLPQFHRIRPRSPSKSETLSPPPGGIQTPSAGTRCIVPPLLRSLLFHQFVATGCFALCKLLRLSARGPELDERLKHIIALADAYSWAITCLGVTAVLAWTAVYTLLYLGVFVTGLIRLVSCACGRRQADSDVNHNRRKRPAWRTPLELAAQVLLAAGGLVYFGSLVEQTDEFPHLHPLIAGAGAVFVSIALNFWSYYFGILGPFLLHVWLVRVMRKRRVEDAMLERECGQAATVSWGPWFSVRPPPAERAKTRLEIRIISPGAV